MYLSRLLSVTASLFCIFLWGCHSGNSQDLAPIMKQDVELGQRIDLNETGLSLRIPAEWEVHKEEHANPETGIVTTLLTNGLLSTESFQQGRGDAIHIMAFQCETEQYRASFLSGAQEVLGQEHARLIQEMRPGDASMPFSEGLGYEIEFENKNEDSLVVSRSFFYKTINNERCYTLAFENLRDTFGGKRAEYAAIAQSVEFFSEK